MGSAELQGRRHMEAQLVAVVQDSLSAHVLDNARFHGERLLASFPTDANKLLLATCYYRSDQAYRAYHLLHGTTDPHSLYMLALCCMAMGKLNEAEIALTPGADKNKVPNGAAGLLLLGRVAKQTNRQTMAIEHFRQALKLDPLLWSAYDELCTMGAGDAASSLLAAAERDVRSQVEVDGLAASNPTAFGHLGGQATPQTAAGTYSSNVASPAEKLPQTPLFQLQQIWTHQAGSSSIGAAAAVAAAEAGAAVAQGGYVSESLREALTPMTANSSAPFTTPSASAPGTGSNASGPPPLQRGRGNAHARNADASMPRGLGTGTALPGRNGRQVATPSTIDSTPGFEHRRKFTGDDSRRRPDDSRFKLQKAQVSDTDDPGSLGAEGEDLGTGAPIPAASGAGYVTVDPLVGLPFACPTKKGMSEVLQLLVCIGDGYRMLSMYQCKEAIEAFQRLPPAQYNTSWVLCQVARAHCEQVEYPAAAQMYEEARRRDPCQLEGMEVYSTVLWHMKKEVELSFLAQETIAMDRHSPQAWCVMGNCFSLQKEHEQALKFFQRALQLDESFTYAHTLCGHEYFASEQFDKGLNCFRVAVRLDRRHYNAWYGIGQIYLRQEKYELAENHFRRALGINPSSSVLHCYLGMALHKLDRNKEALNSFQLSIMHDSKNPLAKFEKALVLQSVDDSEGALKELGELKAILPTEASVFYQMGKIYKKLNRLAEALKHFSTALVLKPPSADEKLIKTAIDRIHVNEDNEDGEI